MGTLRSAVLLVFLFLCGGSLRAELATLSFQPLAGEESGPFRSFQTEVIPGDRDRIWIVVPPVDRPLVLTWGGLVVFQTGDPSGRGRVKTLSSQAVLLADLRSGDRTLTLKWYGPPPLSKGFLVGPEPEVLTWVFVRNALGPGLVGASMVVSLVFALAIGLLLLFTKGALRAIPGPALVLVNLGYTASWLNIVVGLPLVPEVPLAVATHWGFTAWGLSGLYLALEFTGVLDRRWIRRLPWLLAAAAPGLVWMLFSAEPAQVVQRYNWAVLPINLVMDLLTTAVAVLAVVRRPSPRTWGFAALAVPSMLAAFHDIFWFAVLQERPYLSLLPLVGVSLNLYFVVLFFWDTSRLYLHLQEEVRTRTYDLERFVGVLSHDLRNVLHGIGGVSQVLADPVQRPVDPVALERLYQTLGAAAQESHLVLGTLVNLSNVKTGVLVPHPQPIETAALASDALLPFFRPAQERSIRLVGPSGTPVDVLVDREMTLVILRNLVDNALRHGSGGSSVVLSCDLRPEGGMDLTVTDQGTALTRGDLAGLFDWSKKRLRSDRTDGSGFGLVLCRDLALRQGFDLKVSSNDSETRFTLSLPPGNILPANEGKPSLPSGRTGPRVEP